MMGVLFVGLVDLADMAMVESAWAGERTSAEEMVGDEAVDMLSSKLV